MRPETRRRPKELVRSMNHVPLKERSYCGTSTQDLKFKLMEKQLKDGNREIKDVKIRSN